MTDAEKLFQIANRAHQKAHSFKTRIPWADVSKTNKAAYREVAAELKKQGWKPKGKV